jgi:pimeloyl-ACP methyl ester carboxylesterase
MLPRFINHATDEKYAHTSELKQLLPSWQQINIPVTVVQGDSDRIVDPANLEFARRQLRGKQAEFIVLHGAGHLIRWRNADVVRRILTGIGPAHSLLPNKR